MEANCANTVVVIPSYNESRTIGAIVKRIVEMGLKVVIVDDGSIDSTRKAALDNGAQVIRHEENLGKGFALREGIRHILEKTNLEWIIVMDGDGQHYVEDIPVFLDASHEQVDIVVGNRMNETKTMPFLRYWTNRFTSFVISGICRQCIPDTQCGYRLIRREALKKLRLESKKYDIESEILIKAALYNMKIRSVPIQTIYGDEISGIRPVRDTIRFFALIMKYCFGLYGLRRIKKRDGCEPACQARYQRP